MSVDRPNFVQVNDIEPSIGKRAINWPVPIATDHREYTVTENCYLISARKPCFGCTLVNVEEAENGLLYEGGLRMNVEFIKGVVQRQVDEGINLITYMGGEPLTIRGFEEVVKWTTEETPANCLVYSSSAYFFNKKSEKLNWKYDQYKDTGLFDENYFLCSVDSLILSPEDIPTNDDSSATKSYWGLKLAAHLAREGNKDVAIHQTLRTDNLDQTLRLYEWAMNNGVKFSLCPMVYVPYTSRGIPEENYNRHLQESDRPQLQEVIGRLVEEESARIRSGSERAVIQSSAFLRLIPDYGAQNLISCRLHRQGVQPNTQDVHTSGKLRWCIAQNTAEGGQRCGGCHYVGIDRGKSDYWHFEHLAGKLNPGELRWLNYHVWKKDPNFDPSRRNIAFEVIDTQGTLRQLAS